MEDLLGECQVHGHTGGYKCHSMAWNKCTSFTTLSPPHLHRPPHLPTMSHKTGHTHEDAVRLGIDGDVNFQEQDSDALFKVFQERKGALWDKLGPTEIESVHHVGSSAIRGMPGPPAVDMIMFVHTWPPTDAVFKALDDLKFFSMGDAPHYADDKWFGYREEGKSIQDFGSCVVHVVHKDNQEAVNKQILWVEYCNSNKDAFEAYKAIKLAARDTGNFRAYKTQKAQMIQALFPKAQEWKQQQQDKQKQQ